MLQIAAHADVWSRYIRYKFHLARYADDTAQPHNALGIVRMATPKKSGPKGAKRTVRAADRSGGDHGGAEQPVDTLAIDEERYRLALESINHGLYDWEILNNTIYYSPSLRASFGMADGQFQSSRAATASSRWCC